MTTITSTKAFESSIAINADPGADPSATLAQLQYLGIDTIRTGLPGSTSQAAIAPYETLAAAGVKFDVVPAQGGSAPAMPQVQSQLDAIEAGAPGSIASVEGTNEPNIWPISYDGQDGTSAAVAYQNDLDATVKSDPSLAGAQVYNFAFGGVGPESYAAAGNQSGSVDDTNIHVYPDGAGNGAPAPAITEERDLAAVNAPSKPTVMTEFGYSTYAGGDINQTTQARFIVDGLLDQKPLGVSRTFIYDIGDANTGSAGYEDNFGMFASDGTPKAAGVALHDLSAILADSGSGNLPDVQTPTISGLPDSAKTLLMEKSDGTIDLAVWDEGTNVNDKVVLSFPGATNVFVYDPLKSAAAQQSLSSVGTATIDVGSDPLIIALQNAQASAPTPTSTPASVSTPLPATTASPTPLVPTTTAAPSPVSFHSDGGGERHHHGGDFFAHHFSS